MIKPRVLVVAPWPPLPFDAGSRRVWTACKELKDRYEFVLAALARPASAAPGEDAGEAARRAAAALWQESRLLPEAFASVHAVAAPSEPEPLASGRWLPDDVRRHYRREMREALAALALRERVDLVHVEFDLMAPYVRDLRAAFPHAPCLITHHDMGSVSLFRSYFREMTGWGRVRRLGEWFRRLLFTRETLALFDGVVVLTQADRRRLSRLIRADRIHVVPTGVDLDHFARPAAWRSDAQTLVYVGHYPHYPNEDAVLWFAREVLPLIRRARPEVRLQLVGSGPTRSMRALAERDPLIEVTGTVEDVQPYEAAASVVIAPVRLGQGIKGKLLEAFAAGAPVVATSNANEGVLAEPELEILIADDAASFAAQVVRLLEDPGLRARVSTAARAFVEREHAWSRRADQLDALYRASLSRAPARRLDSVAGPRYPVDSGSR